MDKPSPHNGKSHNIVTVVIAVVGLAIVIITVLTVTAIMSGPPT